MIFDDSKVNLQLCKIIRISAYFWTVNKNTSLKLEILLEK